MAIDPKTRNALIFGAVLVIILVAVVIAITLARMFGAKAAPSSSMWVESAPHMNAIPVNDDADVVWGQRTDPTPQFGADDYYEDYEEKPIELGVGIGNVVGNKINAEPIFYKPFLTDVANLGTPAMVAGGESALEPVETLGIDPYTGIAQREKETFQFDF